jgi:hypothetical protein
MAIMQRDRKAIEFIQLVGAATTSQIVRVMGCSDAMARRRLNIIMDELARAGDKSISRYRPDISSQYIYYTGRRPAQTDHSLLVTEVYVKLFALPGRIEVFEIEPVWDSLRPDAFCVFELRPGLFCWFTVEVERLTGNPFNQKKYEDFKTSGKWRDRFTAFPRVLIVTDKRIKITDTTIRYTIVPTNLNGLDQILK